MSVRRHRAFAGLVSLAVVLSATLASAQGALTHGANPVGVLASAGQLDSWTFTATAGSAIVVSAAEIGGDSDLWPWVRIYAPNNALLASAYNAVTAQAAVTATLTGTYTVVVATNDAGNDATGDYRITLALVPGTPVVSAGDEGGPLTNGANHAGALFEGDLDQWTFDATAGAAMVVSAGETGGDTAVWPWVRLYAPNGALVASAYNQIVAQVAATASLSGTYTVLVSSNDSGHAAVGNYQITLALIPGPTPVVPAGDQGGPLTNGANHQGTLHAGDLDQWTFSATAGASAVVSVGEVGGDSAVWPWIRLYGPTGTLIASAYNQVVAQAAITAPATGTYTVVVSSADSGNDDTGNYQITLALVPGPTPVVPVNDQGGPLTNGANHPGTLHVGDLDQWTFDASAGASIVVSVGEVGGDSAVWPWIRLYGPNGTLLVSAYNQVVAQATVTAPLTGRYTVLVSSADAGNDDTDTYQITLALVPGATPTVSPGDQGGALTNGANHSGVLHVGDLDQWTFDAAAGGSIVVSAGEVGGDSAVWPWIRLYAPNGTLLASAYNQVVAQVHVTATLTGTYTALVSSADAGNDAADDYTITLAVVPGPTPVVSPTDQGGAMTNGVTYPGDLFAGDLDQWRFYAAQGSAVNVGLSEIGGDSAVWPWIRLFGPNGTAVVSSYAAEVASASFTAPASGIYTIVVSSADSGLEAEGDYQIVATGISDPPTTADLQLTQMTSATTMNRGGPLTFTLAVTNLGPTSTAANVTVADTLPSTLSLVSCTATGGVVCTGTGNARAAAFGSLAAGASQTVTITATVLMSAGASITNTASASTTSIDANPANNSASVTITIPGTTSPTDTDGDGLPDAWETQFGLAAQSGYGADGAAGDPDDDGRTNAQEYGDGTHPRGFSTRYLAEGARNSFFQVQLALLNVGTAPARVLRRYLQPGGAPLSVFEILAPGQRKTITSQELDRLSSPDFSTVVESDEEVVFDRTMSWGGGYGSHAESGVPKPSTTWYLAEGSTSGDFSLFYLLQNANQAATSVTIRFLLPFGQAPIDRQYALPPNSRTTIPVDALGGVLAATDVSAVITSALPIIVERAMYRSTPTQAFAAGHGSAGVTAAATSWFLAEGATGPFFDCFILLANPQTQPATATIDYLLSDGRTFSKSYTVPAEGRFTVWVDNEEIPAGSGLKPLDNVAVSSTVTSDVPIIVERTMWWPSPAFSADFWTEAHNSPGATATGLEWAMAEGEVGGPQAAETYILIANTSTFAGSARVTLYFEDGTSAQRDFALLPRSRRNVNVSADFPEAAGKRFGSRVLSLGTTPAQIVVERAMYTSPGGVAWAAGTNALASRLAR
jgi:uncharacterized repeat protein (TIGR01451 family)